MGNHSDTGDLLEEARMVAVTEKKASFGDILVDEFGNAIKLDQSPDDTKPANPTKLKDSSGRDVEMIQAQIPNGGMILTPKQADALEAKRNKKKAS